MVPFTEGILQPSRFWTELITSIDSQSMLRSLSVVLLSSLPLPSLPLYPGLSHSRCRIWHLPLLNFIQLVIVHLSNLLRAILTSTNLPGQDIIFQKSNVLLILYSRCLIPFPYRAVLLYCHSLPIMAWCFLFATLLSYWFSNLKTEAPFNNCNHFLEYISQNWSTK